ncbi:hypothetical protein HDU67_004283 [Dinochytrium kinnereticum]|nr:hypothetical protein HDU67_004283 [Dinochytrium kinnereticum]
MLPRCPSTSAAATAIAGRSFLLLTALGACKPHAPHTASPIQPFRPFHTTPLPHSRFPALYVATNRRRQERQEKRETILANRILKRKNKRKSGEETTATTTEGKGSKSKKVVKEALPNQIVQMRRKAKERTLFAHYASASLNPPYDAAHPAPSKPRVLPLLAGPGNPQPEAIKPYDLMGTLEALKKREAEAGQEISTGDASTSSRSMRSIKAIHFEALDQNDRNTGPDTRLTLPDPAQFTTPPQAVRVPKKLISAHGPAQPKVPTTSSGSAFDFGITDQDAGFLFGEAPKALAGMIWGEDGVGSRLGSGKKREDVEEQAEMVRRLTALENSGMKGTHRWNRARMVEVFGRRPFDTGSPEVQAAIFTVKIEAMKSHLEKFRKDMSTKRQLQKVLSKRTNMLKYLRRKNLPRFVETCHALGIEPDSI